MCPDSPCARVLRAAAALLATALLYATPGATCAQTLPPALRDAVAGLPPDARAAAQARQARLDALTPAAHARLEARADAWHALPPARRRAARDAWNAWRALPLAERERMRTSAMSYATLPEPTRRMLRVRFDALDDSERQGWLLGPTLGADFPRLHALLAQVPAPQREPLLAALRAMSPEARDDLAVLAQRTPPYARDALRAGLLAQSPAQRDAWLRRQVDP